MYLGNRLQIYWDRLQAYGGYITGIWEREIDYRYMEDRLQAYGGYITGISDKYIKGICGIY